MNQWIDVHTHLNMLETSPEESVKMAQDAGVQKMITIGTGPDDLKTVLELAQKFAPDVYCSLGVHPHDANLLDEATLNFIKEKASNPEVAAIGETGLDYYYGHSPVEVQKVAFRKQLEVAVDQDLPVEIHTRDAEDDTIEILKSFAGKVRGILHCFTGTQKMADEALALGLNISISGIVTFKRADELREVVHSIPLDRMHVETDAPFLAPVPFRGKKNTPAYVVHVAEYVAEMKKVDIAEFSQQMKKNALNMFSKINWN